MVEKTSVAKGARGAKTAARDKEEISFHALADEIEALSIQLAHETTPKGIMQTLANHLVENVQVATTGVWLLKGASTLELAAMAGRHSLPAEFAKRALGHDVLGRALEERRPQVLAGPQAARDELGVWAQKHHLGFAVAHPLAHDSEKLGVLFIACEEAPGEPQTAIFRLQARLLTLALRDWELLQGSRKALDKLSILIEASKALGSTLDLAELLSRILEVAKTQAGAERGTLFLVDEAASEIWSLIAHGLEKQEIRLPLGKGIAGHVAQTGEIVNIPDAYADPRFNPEVDKRTGYRTRNILCLPIRNKGGKIIAALQLLNREAGPFTDEDTDFLLTLSGHMALALENAQLHQQILEKERMEKELALARGIQRSLLPQTTPLVDGYDIALLNEPCYTVGGDYYDFLTLGPRNLLVVIADVEGKGVASAMVMSNLQATLRALVLHLHSLNEIAESLNRMMWNETRAEKYLSLFIGLIDTKHKVLHYINCGHVPPLVVRKGSDPITLTEGGMVIGLFEKAPYDRGHLQLQSGDLLILCTDGITEAMDVRSDEYGSERLAKKVAEVADKKATEIVESVSEDVTRFSRQGTHIDDKVMIVIKTL